MKIKTRQIFLLLVLYLLTLAVFIFSNYRLRQIGDYRRNKVEVKTLETNLNFKKMEEESLKEEISQGKEALRHLNQLEKSWKEKEKNPIDAKELEAYLFNSSLNYYPQLSHEESPGGVRSSPFYEEETVDALSKSLALRQTLNRLNQVDLEASLAANSAIFRRMGFIQYFYESKEPGAWYALLKGQYHANPGLEKILANMRGQMEGTIALKTYIGQILSPDGSPEEGDLALKKQLWLKGGEEEKFAGDYKQAFNDVSYNASFLMDTYFYGLEDLKIKAKSLSTNDFVGMVKGYYKDMQIYYLSIKTEEDQVMAYFTKSGLLIAVFNVDTGEAYYLKGSKKEEKNRWAQIADLGYQIIKTELQESSNETN